MTYELLEIPPPPALAVGSVVDTVTLSKPLGWQPQPKATQAAIYSSIVPTPEPTKTVNDTNTAALVYFLKSILLPENVVEGLVAQYLPPGSEAWNGTYQQV